LCTPYREVLAEITADTYSPLNTYIDRVMGCSKLCTDIVLPKNEINIHGVIQTSTKFCRVSLLDNQGMVQAASGLNWGHGKGHVTINDACLVIRTSHISDHPQLFPPLQDYSSMLTKASRSKRKNDQVEIIWDDGTIMGGLLEGSQLINGIKHPKNFSSSPSKNIIGEYLRKRLGVVSGNRVTLDDLKKYGRTNIDISLQAKGIYFFDFSR